MSVSGPYASGVTEESGRCPAGEVGQVRGDRFGQCPGLLKVPAAGGPVDGDGERDEDGCAGGHVPRSDLGPCFCADEGASNAVCSDWR